MNRIRTQEVIDSNLSRAAIEQIFAQIKYTESFKPGHHSLFQKRIEAYGISRTKLLDLPTAPKFVGTKVVHIWGPAGSGKTTLSLDMTSFIKKCQVSVENTSEFAKLMILQGREHMLGNQFVVSMQQYRRVAEIVAKTKVIINDSPFGLGIVYNKQLPACFETTLGYLSREFEGYNIYLQPREERRTVDTGSRLEIHLDEEYDIRVMETITNMGITISSIKEVLDNIVDVSKIDKRTKLYRDYKDLIGRDIYE